jgi:hypothetical protein
MGSIFSSCCRHSVAVNPLSRSPEAKATTPPAEIQANQQIMRATEPTDSRTNRTDWKRCQSFKTMGFSEKKSGGKKREINQTDETEPTKL